MVCGEQDELDMNFRGEQYEIYKNDEQGTNNNNVQCDNTNGNTCT